MPTTGALKTRSTSLVFAAMATLLAALTLGLLLPAKPALAAINANAPNVTVNEGNTAFNSGRYQNPLFLPSSTTITASVGSVSKTGTTSGTWSWSFRPDDGPSGSRLVTITARHSSPFATSTESVTFQLNVNNVAPNASFNRPASVAEGSPINLSLTNPFDPSFADRFVGFSYAFGCGPFVGPFGLANSASCSTDDNGVRAVSAAIRDKDGGINNFGANVTVTNVAPTATLIAPDSAGVGSTFSISLVDPRDPSSVDITAGFRYAFDCGSGFGSLGFTNTASCEAGSGASKLVKAKIVDKDGGETVTEKLVQVNAAPSISALKPAPGSSTKDTTPLLSAVVKDRETNLTKSNIKLFLDGRRITTFSYSSSTDKLVYVSKKLAVRKHTVKIEATDAQGRKTTKSWSFKVIKR